LCFVTVFSLAFDSLLHPFDVLDCFFVIWFFSFLSSVLLRLIVLLSILRKENRSWFQVTTLNFLARDFWSCSFPNTFPSFLCPLSFLLLGLGFIFGLAFSLLCVSLFLLFGYVAGYLVFVMIS